MSVTSSLPFAKVAPYNRGVDADTVGEKRFFPALYTFIPVHPVMGRTLDGDGSPVPLCTGSMVIDVLLKGLAALLKNEMILPVKVTRGSSPDAHAFNQCSRRTIGDGVLMSTPHFLARYISTRVTGSGICTFAPLILAK